MDPACDTLKGPNVQKQTLVPLTKARRSTSVLPQAQTGAESGSVPRPTTRMQERQGQVIGGAVRSAHARQDAESLGAWAQKAVLSVLPHTKQRRQVWGRGASGLRDFKDAAK